MPNNKKFVTHEALFLIIITFITFYAALHCDFSFIDDPVYTVKNPLVTTYNIKDIFTQSYFSAYIPITLITYCADYFLYGWTPAGYHFTNLLIHMINSILLFFLIIRLTKGNKSVAFLTALIFAVHPLQVQSVVWISARKGLLSPLFMLLSFNHYINYKETKKAASYITCFILLTCALLAKPSAVTLFLLFIAYDIFLQKERVRGTILNKLPFIAISGVISYITIVVQSGMGAVKDYHGGSFFTNLITIPKGITHYFTTTIFPKDLLFYYSIEPAQTIFDPYTLLGIFLVALLIYLMVSNKKERGIISFGISIFFIFLLPVSNIVPIETIASDRYMYIPIIGLSLALFSALDRRTSNFRGSYYAVMTLIVSLLCFTTITDLSAWRTKDGIWEEILKESPENLEAINTLSELHLKRGNKLKAYALMTKSLSLNENEPRALKNMALFEKEFGNINEALEYLKRAVKYDAQDKELYLELAKLYYEKGEYDEAEKMIVAGANTKYEFALDIRLKFDYVLANIHVKRIEFDEAINLFNSIKERSGDHMFVDERLNPLLKHIDEFNRNSELFIKSGGAKEYRDNLRAIFAKLNLRYEGELYITNLVNKNR